MARSAAKNTEKAAPDASMRIVVLHGDEDFLLSARTKQLIQSLRGVHGEIEQFQFDGETASLAQVLDELRSYGLMQTFKLVIVDDADAFLKRDNHREAIERYAASPMPEATLLFRCSTWYKGKLDAMIEKVGAILTCDSPNEARAVKWCIDRGSSQHKIEIEPEAAAMLVERIGTSLTRLDAELGKLSCMVEEGHPVTAALVREAVGLSKEEQAWSLQSTVLQGDPGSALRRLEELMRISRAPTELLMWSVTDLVRKLHGASSFLRQGMGWGDVAKAMRLWGADASLVMNLAKAAPPRSWAQLLQESVDADLRSKTGLADSDRVVEAITVTVADKIRATQGR